jgi:hypothetical protein
MKEAIELAAESARLYLTAARFVGHVAAGVAILIGLAAIDAAAGRLRAPVYP